MGKAAPKDEPVPSRELHQPALAGRRISCGQEGPIKVLLTPPDHHPAVINVVFNDAMQRWDVELVPQAGRSLQSHRLPRISPHPEHDLKTKLVLGIPAREPMRLRRVA